jgi:hypothetical protein
MAKKKREIVAALFALTSFILFFVFIAVGEGVGFFFWLILIVVFYKVYEKIKAKEEEKEIVVETSRAETKSVREILQAEYPVSVVVKTETPEQPVAGIKILLTGPGIRETKSTDGLGSTKFIVPVGEYTISTEHVQGYERPKPEHITVETERIVKLIMKRKVCDAVVQVIDEKIRVPISGVSVSLGETRSTTGDEGKVYFSNVPVGAQKIIVESKPELYEPITKECELIERVTNEIQIALKPKSFLNQRQRTELEQTRKTLSDAFSNVPGYCDKGIPKYLHDVGMVVLGVIARASSGAVYFLDSSVPPSDALKRMIEVANEVSREITGVMLSEKNIDLYAAIEKSSSFTSSPLPQFDFAKSISVYDNKLKNLISNPEGFSNVSYGETQKKMTRIDDEITAKMREFTTVPVSGMWRISKQLLKYADAEIESGLKKGVMIFMADLLLDCTKRMFEIPEIVERLRLKPF